MAETIDATGYMPSAAVWDTTSPVWNYDSGTYMSQGTGTFAGQTAHVVYSSHDDAYFYWQITSAGLSLLGAYYPHVDSTTGSSLTATYSGANDVAGLLLIPTTATIGQSVAQSGSLSYQWSSGATATLQYHSVMTFTGIESKTITFRGKETSFKALKRQETLQVSGKIGESYVSTVADSSSDYA